MTGTIAALADPWVMHVRLQPIYLQWEHKNHPFFHQANTRGDSHASFLKNRYTLSLSMSRYTHPLSTLRPIWCPSETAYVMPMTNNYTHKNMSCAVTWHFLKNRDPDCDSIKFASLSIGMQMVSGFRTICQGPLNVPKTCLPPGLCFVGEPSPSHTLDTHWRPYTQ